MGGGAEGQQDPPLSTQGTHEHPTIMRRWVCLPKVISAPAKLAALYDKPNCPAPSLTYTHSGLLPRGTCSGDGWADSHERAVCWIFPDQHSENWWPPGFTGAFLAPGGLREGSVNWIFSSPVYLSVIGNDVFFIHPWGCPLLSPDSSEIHQSLYASMFVLHWVSGGKKRRSVCCS